MSVLVTNNYLERLGGSETFTYTLVKEIQRREGEVDVFTFHKSDIFKELPFVDKLKDEYDIIFANHNSCVKCIKHIKGFKFQTCHGTTPELEQPESGIDHYVSISEEVQAHLRSKGFESTVIRNGVDCERFGPKRPINKECKSVFCICQGKEAISNIAIACEKLNLEFFYINDSSFPLGHNNQRSYFKIEEFIDRADLVFTLGRGAYESMACGRNVIVYDSRSYMESKADGIITPETINDMLETNCSGRRFNYKYDADDVIEEIKKYKPEYGEYNRAFALENLNIRKQLDKYIRIHNKHLVKGVSLED
jgi:hypothetical protein